MPDNNAQRSDFDFFMVRYRHCRCTAFIGLLHHNMAPSLAHRFEAVTAQYVDDFVGRERY